MATPPSQYFRKEDFPELRDQPWVTKLFQKLNGLARQTQFGIDGNLSISQNILSFWWKGIIGYNKLSTSGVVFPYAPNSSLPAASKAKTPSITAFPFVIPNQKHPAKIVAIIVGYAADLTDGVKSPVPALLGPVAWTDGGVELVVHAIGGTVQGRCYDIRLLLLGE